MSLPEPVCLKADKLRRLGFDNLQEYNASPDNVSVCRAGRVMVKFGSTTGVYNYRASPWANPFRVGTTRKKVPLERSLELYAGHLDALLRDSEKMAEFKKLAEKKRIGCFCTLGEPCHRDIILDRLKRHTQRSTLHDE